MATVVLASELGGGLGHVAKLLAVGHALRAVGHRLVLAVPSVLDVSGLLENGLDVVQAPVARPTAASSPSRRRAASYAHILDAAGYGDENALSGFVEAWHQLLSRTGATLLVADHAPTACLAAYGVMPSVVIGTGFTVPPVNGSRFPAIDQPDETEAPDARLHDIVTRVLQARHQPVPPTLPAAIAGSARFPCCSPELDPYEARRLFSVAGPLNALPFSAPPPAPRFLAYLTAGPQLEPLVAGLAESGVPGDLVVRGAPFLAQLVAGSRVTVHDRPPAAAEVVPQATVVVHHGGTLSEAALSAGRPQLLVPRYLEQELTARALVRLGAGVVASIPVSAAGIAAAVAATATDASLMARAQHVAVTVAARALDPLPAVVASCVDLLVSSNPSGGPAGIA